MKTFWPSIKSNLIGLVKGPALIAFFCALPAHAASGDSGLDVHDADTFPPAVSDHELNDIEAKTYTVSATAQSESGRAYLFTDPSGAAPMVGKILLLKKDDEPIMAFRVLQTIPEQKRFIARRVRRYGSTLKLDLNYNYSVVERSNEIALPPGSAEIVKQDQADLKNLISQPETEDPPLIPPANLQNGTEKELHQQSDQALKDVDQKNTASPLPEPSPDPQPSPPSQTADPTDDDTPITVSVDEFEKIDPTNHWLTAEFGYFQNNAANGGTQYFTAGGFRYAYSFSHFIFAKTKTMQDSLAAEGSMFFYKAEGYANPNDSYQIVPLEATLRYTLFPSETFGFFLYGGFVYNYIASSSNAVQGALTNLGTTTLALGTGLVIRVGPNWELRLDLGFDMLGAGLMLRF